MKKYIIEHEDQLTINEPEISYFLNSAFLANFENINKITSPYSITSSKQHGIKNYTFSKTISEFSKLQPNWDSYNSEPISQDAIITAQTALRFLNKEGYLSRDITINIFPMRDGGIQFEFDSDSICAELEISKKGILTFISFDNEGNIVNKEQLFELSELSLLLEEFDYA